MNDIEKHISALSKNEVRALELMVEHYDPFLVANRMHVTSKTLETYLVSAEVKLECRNLVHLLLAYDRWKRERTTTRLDGEQKVVIQLR